MCCVLTLRYLFISHGEAEKLKTQGVHIWVYPDQGEFRDSQWCDSPALITQVTYLYRLCISESKLLMERRENIDGGEEPFCCSRVRCW